MTLIPFRKFKELLSEEALQTRFGRVYKNPSRLDVMSTTKEDGFDMLRSCKHKKDIYAWNANSAQHDDILGDIPELSKDKEYIKHFRDSNEYRTKVGYHTKGELSKYGFDLNSYYKDKEKDYKKSQRE